MTPAGGGGQPVVLSAAETAMVREALAACSRMLTWAHQHGGPAAAQLVADLTGQQAGGRSPGGVLYDINLAIDYLDFARWPELAVTAAAPAPPPLDAGLEQLLRRMRLPHMRRAAPEVAGHRQSAAVGPGRSAAGAAGRGSHRAGPLRAGHPPRPGRLPHREDLQRLGRSPASIPAPPCRVPKLGLFL